MVWVVECTSGWAKVCSAVWCLCLLSCECLCRCTAEATAGSKRFRPWPCPWPLMVLCDVSELELLEDEVEVSEDLLDPVYGRKSLDVSLCVPLWWTSAR